MAMIDVVVHQPMAQAIGWALLQFVWQGLVVGLLAAAALTALRRSAADVRYIVGTIALALMLTLPVVTAVQRYSTIVAQGVAAATLPASATGPAAHAATRHAITVSRTTRHSSDAATPLPSLLGQSLPVPGWESGLRSDRVLPFVMIVWLAGVMILSVRLLTGWLWVRRMRTHGVSPAEPSWDRMVHRLARQLHISRAIVLFESTLVDVPTVVGWIKPAVLLPVSALGGLSPHQLEAILGHELAHIRRHDYAVNLLQTLVETLLFYHPAIWWVSRRVRAERENCCDDLAVALCGDPIAYANALADLETLRSSMPSLRRLERTALAATGGSLVQRVRRLLGAPSQASMAPASLVGVTMMAVIACLALTANGVRAQAGGGGMQHPTLTNPVGEAAAQAEATADREREAIATQMARDAATLDRMRSTAAAQEPERRWQRESAVLATTRDEQAAQRNREAALQAQVAREAAALDRMRSAAAARQAAEGHAAAQVDARAPLAATAVAVAQTNTVVAEAQVRAAEARTREAEAAVAVSAPSSQSVSSHQDNSSGNWSWSNNGEKLDVTYSGTFEFSDDDSDITQMSPGALFRISDGAWFGRHSVEIREANGQIERHYYVNGSERPFEPDGRQWLRDHLPKFARNTGIDAPARVARLLKSGGPSAVLAEIDRIDGAYVKGVYYRELFKQAPLTPNQYRDVLAQAGREMRGNDYTLGQLLIAIAPKLPDDDQSRAAYFDAAASLSSSYEIRRVYTEMLKRGPVNDRTLVDILDHIGTMTGDYDRSELLRAILSQQSLNDRTRAPFFRAMAGLHGDYERHRVLSAALQRSTDRATVEAVLTAAAMITGDYDKSMLLQEVLKSSGVEGPLRAPFFAAVDGLHSSYERGRVLQAVARRADASDDTIRDVLDAANSMSGYDLSQVLMTVARSHALKGSLRDAYLRDADKLSNYDQGQVMTALVRAERGR